MRNLLPVALANLRRGKGQAVSLFLFVLIAAMLLNLGLLLLTRYNGFFETRGEVLHAPHYVLVEEKRLYTQSQMDYLKAYPGVTEVETEAVPALSAEIDYNGGKMPVKMLFLRTGAPRSMNDLTLIEGRAPGENDEICLPYMFKVGGGYNIGDRFTMNSAGESFSYRISGFTEEIMCGSVNINIYQTYLSPEGFTRLSARIPALESVILRVRMADPAESKRLNLDCTKAFFFQEQIAGADALDVISFDWDDVKSLRTMMSGITATVLVLFAAMIMLICLLVIRFRIRNAIEENMTNIGALKAVGYTGRQLLWATVLQFCLISIIGILAGIGLSYGLLPGVSDILEQQTAIRWRPGFDSLTSLISFAAILLAVLVVTGSSAGRIRKLQPLIALRQGLVTHSFKRNYFPLDRTRGALPLLLALKSVLQSKGQMVMIFFIVGAVSFSATAGLSIYDNLGVHSDSFAKLLAGELPDAVFSVRDPGDVQPLREAVTKSGKIRKVFYFQDFTVMIDDRKTSNAVTEDFSLLEGGMLYEGRYPRHDNEICVSGVLAAQSKLAIGETVKVTQGGRTADYLIVGLVQTMNNGGISCAMTISGVRRIQPDYLPHDLYVYLKGKEKGADLVKSMESSFGERLENAIDMKELMTAQLGVYGSIFRVVTIVIVATTILVILMVLYLMLKTVILRRRRELGIQKALGFTTLQLMNQFILHFLPAIALGVAAGGLGGILGFNAIFTLLAQRLGVMTASMPAPLLPTILMCASLVLLAYAFAMLIAWRIRKVSAYALVTE